MINEICWFWVEKKKKNENKDWNGNIVQDEVSESVCVLPLATHQRMLIRINELKKKEKKSPKLTTYCGYLHLQTRRERK